MPAAAREDHRRALALVLNQVHGFFRSAIIRGMRSFAAEAGVDLFVLVGIPESIPGRKAIDPAFRLAASGRIDGVIAGGTKIGLEERDSVAEFLRGLGKPVISISNRLPGIPCVHADNRSGVSRAVEHLALVHGRKSIAFLGGPSWSNESRVRLEGFETARRALGLPPDPSLVFPGDFLPQSGIALARARASGAVPAFDALVCANDGMAIAFQAAGEELGVKVPRDVALCGFDDDPEALLIPSPLTTTRQPFMKLCEIAGAALLARLEKGAPLPDDLEAPTEFIVRQSCGCSLMPPLEGAAAAPGGRRIAADFAAQAAGADVAALLDALEREAAGRAEAGSFRAELTRELDSVAGAKDEVYDLRAALSGMFSTLASRPGAAAWLDRAKALLNEGELLLAEAVGERHVRDIRYLRTALSLVDEFSRGVGKAPGEERDSPSWPRPAAELGKTLNRALAEARIGFCSVSLFGEGGQAEAPSESLLAYSLGGSVRPHQLPLAFATEEILPAAALPAGDAPFSCIVLPLVDAALAFGFAFFRDEPGAMDYSIHEIMRSQISNALGRARVEAELVDKETRERVEIEKLAAMGTLVAGVAHEINTPLGICVTASSHAAARADAIRASYANGALTRAELESFLSDLGETCSILESNLGRAASLVSSFKRIAADSSGEERRFFRLRGYIDDILAALSPALKRTRLRLDIDCPEGLEIDSYPGAFSQVLTNLIQNSIVHGYDEPVEGTVGIRASVRDGRLTLAYSDDGKGISKEILGRIFDPYFTTRRESGGSGLGLYIVHNIVTGIFKGRISAGEAPGGGARFVITIPLKDEEYRHVRKR